MTQTMPAAPTDTPPPVMLNAARGSSGEDARAVNRASRTETAISDEERRRQEAERTSAALSTSPDEDVTLGDPDELDEDAIVSGIIEAATTRSDRRMRLPVYRTINGERKKVLEFIIRPLRQEDYQACFEGTTQKINQGGIPRYGTTDYSRLHSSIIYEATEGERGKKVWDRPAIKRALSDKGIVCMNGEEVVSATFNAGEKALINQKIDEISGYSAADLEGKDVVQRLKNR